MPVSPRPKETNPQPSRTQLRVDIRSDVAAHYQEIADNNNKSIEQVVSERLETTANYYEAIPGRPLFFNNEERQELEQILAKNIFSTRDALVLVKNVVGIKIGSQKISLKPDLIQRLKSRCIKMDWDQFLEETVVKQLEQFVGMR